MNIFETYGKEIVALLVPLITWLLNTHFRAKAKLLVATPHVFSFLVQQPLVDAQGNEISPTQTVNTQSLLVWNKGKEAATNVEWVFNWKPECINIWPVRHFEELIEADNRYVMIFKSLAPNEHMGCEIFSINKELPQLGIVRSDQCVADNIVMYPQPVLPNWKRRIAVVLLLAGLAAVVYIAIATLQFLVLKTPLTF